ncbi:MAG: hypothetical protein HY057_14995 [Rhodospirillales bacterium]|nr:hypothetical protein [Rhodospirillales bacterium]
MLPFASGLNPARRDVLLRLFEFRPGEIPISQAIEYWSIAQSVTGAVLLFLFLLAIRNRFKIG